MSHHHSHSHSHGHSHANASLNKRAILVAVGISVVLVALKAYGWFVTDSVSVLTSLLDSSFDVFISLINMFAVVYAAKPADDQHRFGHTAIEDIVGLIQATFIGASGLFVVYEAVKRFINPRPITESETGIWVIGVSIAFALVIVIYEQIAARKTGSLVVKAEILHYASDLLLNAAIIVSLLLASRPEFELVDPLLALAIAAYILRGAWQIGKRAFNNLMDRELEHELIEQIEAAIVAHEGVLGLHNLKTRRSGSRVFIQFHLDMDANLSFIEAHKITESLEHEILHIVPDAEVILHQEPVGACEVVK